MSRAIRRSDHLTRASLERRRVCAWLLLPAAQWLVPARANAATVASARLWPAQEYTRLILEAPSPVAHQLLAMRNPGRLVLDLEGIDVNPELLELPRRVAADDPYIQAIRVAPFRPGVLRIVLELKSQVNPQLFALNPVGDYGYRVVLDLYPLTPPDPLMALLEDVERAGRPADASSLRAEADKPARSEEQGKAAPRHGAKRLIVVAIDPGHGGEDPGAIRRRGTDEKTVTLPIA